MYGNYFYSPFFLPINYTPSYFNNFMYCPSEFKHTEELKVHCKFQPQSYTTKSNLVKIEQNIPKKQFQVKSQRIQTRKFTIKEGRRNKSIFHNYQKHLVTTLKQKITIKQLKQMYPDDECAIQLWHSFISSKIANRALLLAIFGEEEDKQQEIKKYLQKCEFSEIMSKFSMELIKKSQKNLRNLVKLVFKQKNLDQQLESRKLQTQEKYIFKQYVTYFLSQLGQGMISKRFPKKFKKQMMI